MLDALHSTHAHRFRIRWGAGPFSTCFSAGGIGAAPFFAQGRKMCLTSTKIEGRCGSGKKPRKVRDGNTLAARNGVVNYYRSHVTSDIGLFSPSVEIGTAYCNGCCYTSH